MKFIKDFIPYNEALELKELGFDEPCFGYYDSKSTLTVSTNKTVVKDWVWIDNSLIPIDMTLAPLFSQAFRFFLEKYDLDYSLLPESSSGYKLLDRTYNIVIYKYYVNMNVQAEIVRIDGKIARYNKREEAELACLKKLIEIVKQKR